MHRSEQLKADENLMYDFLMKVNNGGICLEGSKGLNYIDTLTKACGYDDFRDMLENNSGLIEAIETWVTEMMPDEWREGIRKVVVSTQ